MQITFWGVRGSYPVPGAATVRYGGQTSCVEVRSDSGDCIIVDAGTGMRALGNKLAGEAAGRPGQYHVLLSHVHWDHIQGLPFFSPAYINGTRISVYALLTAADELNQVIGGITRHEFFPMPLEAVPASFDFWRANLNFESSSGISMPSESLNPTARLPPSATAYITLIASPDS